MSAAEQLLQLADEAAALKTQFDQIEVEWDRLNNWAIDSDVVSEVQSAVSQMEALSPRRDELILRLNAIEETADALFEQAKDEFEQTIQPARELISDVYQVVPVDADSSASLQSLRDWIAQALEDPGPGEILSARNVKFLVPADR